MPTQFAESGREIAQALMAEGSPIDLFSPLELARLTGTQPSYWAQHRSQQTGPHFFKDGHYVRYRRIDLIRWFVRQGQEVGVPRV